VSYRLCDVLWIIIHISCTGISTTQSINIFTSYGNTLTYRQAEKLTNHLLIFTILLWNFLTLSFCFFPAFSRGILITMRVEAGLDHEPDDQQDRRNWRVHTDAEHVQPRIVCEHARELPLFVRRRIRVRRQLPSMHRCERRYELTARFSATLNRYGTFFNFLFQTTTSVCAYRLRVGASLSASTLPVRSSVSVPKGTSSGRPPESVWVSRCRVRRHYCGSLKTRNG